MVTLEDISIEVGCSVNTVSKALNNKPDVSEAMRNRIIEAAKRLGYVPNTLAKSLVTKTTGTIGIVVPSVLNPLYTELVEPLTMAASRATYSTFLAISNYNRDRETGAVENFFQKRVDGLIIVPINALAPYHQMLERFNVPVVYLLDDIQDTSSHFIGVDLRECAFLAANRLLQAGRSRLVLVYRDGGNPNSLDRMVKGFQAALAQNKTPFSETQLIPFPARSDWLGLPGEVDGAVLENDNLYWEAQQELTRRSRKSPDALQLSACISSRQSVRQQLPLSANGFDLERLAEDAFTLLMELVKNPAAGPAVRKILHRPR